MSLLSALVSIPTFAWFHKFASQCFHWNFSHLDRITLAAALDDKRAVYSVLLLTLIYSMLAYGFLLSFCYQMSNTEFTSQEQFIDKFAANHAVFIRGVNKQISTKVAQQKVRKVFEHRFGKGEVISCHAYKNCSQAQKIYKQVKVFKAKLDDLNQRLKETGDRIGKLKKGTRLEVDAISYYE